LYHHTAGISYSFCFLLLTTCAALLPFCFNNSRSLLFPSLFSLFLCIYYLLFAFAFAFVCYSIIISAKQRVPPTTITSAAAVSAAIRRKSLMIRVRTERGIENIFFKLKHNQKLLCFCASRALLLLQDIIIILWSFFVKSISLFR